MTESQKKRLLKDYFKIVQKKSSKSSNIATYKFLGISFPKFYKAIKETDRDILDNTYFIQMYKIYF